MGYSGETNDINFSSGTTAFYGFLGFLINGESTNGAGLSESNVQMPFSAGTISLLWCRVTTAATSSSTVTLRKNSANATNTFSINANTTGAFSDTIPDNDSIATGDLIAVKVVAGSSALIIDIIACTFAASSSSNTITRLGCMDEVPNAPSGPATWYMPGAGVDSNSGSFITSETGVKLRHRKAMMVKNLAAYFFNSGDPDTVTVHSRKNGVNGNLTCSIASQSNALGQDTSNSDSIAVGDDYDFSFAGQGNGSPGSGNMITVDYISTNGDCIFACQNAAGTSFNTSVTQYFGLSGSLVSGQSAETSAQVTVNTAFQFSQLTCNVTSNGITNASTINLRANSGNAGPAVSITGSTTGIFSDSINTYSAATTDAINYQVVTSSAGTSMKIAFIAVWGNSAVQVTPVTKYKHFRNVPSMKPPFTPNLDIGNQYVTFG